jgi:hypothetical protein
MPLVALALPDRRQGFFCAPMRKEVQMANTVNSDPTVPPALPARDLLAERDDLIDSLAVLVVRQYRRGCLNSPSSGQTCGVATTDPNPASREDACQP